MQEAFVGESERESARGSNTIIKKMFIVAGIYLREMQDNSFD